MVICPVCGASNPEGSAFCIVCGSKLQYLGVPSSVFKKYEIYADKGNIDFHNEDNVSEITVKKSGLLENEHLILESGSVIGKIKEDKVYDSAGSTLLAMIKSPNLKPTQNKLKNYLNSTLSGATGVPVVRSYWIEDASGNVLAKTVEENASDSFFNSIPYLTYNIVDEKDMIAKVVPRTSVVNVNFLHLRYQLYVYLNKLQPAILVSLIYAIKRGDDTWQWLYAGYGGV
ncbi:MAG: zinc-ribbon domain-containing protein [Nitrososphaeria archaeon]